MRWYLNRDLIYYFDLKTENQVQDGLDIQTYLNIATAHTTRENIAWATLVL